MFPPNPDLLDPFREGEPTTASADLLFRIPLWMDISMHALPAISLLIGESESRTHFPAAKSSYRLLPWILIPLINLTRRLLPL
jgi:hypothetical protein